MFIMNIKEVKSTFKLPYFCYKNHINNIIL
jgi:hypothetical protein